jgi:hypothetical protein
MSTIGLMERTFMAELREELILKLFVIFLFVYCYDLIEN